MSFNTIKASIDAVSGNKTQVSFEVERQGTCFKFGFLTTEALSQISWDAVIPLLLPAGMALDEPIHINHPIDRELLEGTDSIQTLLHFWYPKLKKVPILAAPSVEGKCGTETAMFFSGGVDSFYNLLKMQDKVDALIAVYGFDFPLTDKTRQARTSTFFREIAKRFSKKLIEVEIDFKPFAEKYGDWGQWYHGAALASIALLHGHRFRRVVISATHTFLKEELGPWGSHPLLDPLWRSSKVRILHEGAEAGRLEKMKFVASDPWVLSRIRVCRDSFNPKINCGHCGKCVRSLLGFAAIGKLDQLQSFEGALDPLDIEQVHLENENATRFHYENLEALKKSGNYPTLARALELALGKSPIVKFGRLNRLRRYLIRKADYQLNRLIPIGSPSSK